MFYYFDSLYLAFIGISLVIMLSAQFAVNSRFTKYSKIKNLKGITGAKAAEMVLASEGVTGVRIERVTGKLTDHFDPRSNVIRLSDSVYDSSSIAAVGIAAHEAGHAIQYARHYTPIKIRNSIIPISSYGPSIGVLLMIFGSIFNFQYLITAGIVLFSFAFIFQLVTLPVEFNASRRALTLIKNANLLDSAELSGARKVLWAAAMTYVAAMIQTFLTLLYYIIRFSGNRRR